MADQDKSELREKKARLLGEVILIIVEGAVKLILVMVAIITALYVLQVWLGLGPLHAVWVLLGAPVVIAIVVFEMVARRRRSRGGNKNQAGPPAA